MGEREHDRLLYKTAPSRLISAHYYFLTFVLAGLSGSLSLGVLSLDLPEVVGVSLDIFLPLALGVLAFILFLYAELRRITRRYMIFENRVARREGILSKRIQYMPYSKVERVVMNQSIIKRIFGLGDIIIDTGEDSIVFGAVRNPGRVEGLVSQRLSLLSGTRLQL